MQAASNIAPIRRPTPEEFRADAERLKKISDAWDRAVAARNAVRLVKARNKRCLDSAEAELTLATAALGELVTGVKEISFPQP